jgi:predicted nucleotidyltransferase
LKTSRMLQVELTYLSSDTYRLLSSRLRLKSMRDEVRLRDGHLLLLEVYVSLLKELFGDRLRSVCLFGSVARGEDTSVSDVDLLVVAEGLPEDVGLRHRETNEVRMRIRETDAYRRLKRGGAGCLISEVYLTPEEVERHPPILLDIAEEGVLLYDKDGFLSGVLAGLRRRLKELGARRISGSKGKYWILKPDVELGEEVRV